MELQYWFRSQSSTFRTNNNINNYDLGDLIPLGLCFKYTINWHPKSFIQRNLFRKSIRIRESTSFGDTNAEIKFHTRIQTWQFTTKQCCSCTLSNDWFWYFKRHFYVCASSMSMCILSMCMKCVHWGKSCAKFIPPRNGCNSPLLNILNCCKN